MKLKVGDPVLITGYAHFEKAEVVAIKNGAYHLNNQMVINSDFDNLVRSNMKAEAWNEDKYNYLKARYLIPVKLSTIQRHWRSLSDEEALALFNKLNHIIKRHNL